MAAILAFLLVPNALPAQDDAPVRIAVELEDATDLAAESLREGLTLVVEAVGRDSDQPLFSGGEGLMLFVLAVDDGKPIGVWGSRRIHDLTPGRNALEPDRLDLPPATSSSRRTRGGEALVAALAEARLVRGQVPYLPATRLMRASQAGSENVDLLRDAVAEVAGSVDGFVAVVVLPMEPDDLARTAVRPLFGILP